jgi:hypothetical protein
MRIDHLKKKRLKKKIKTTATVTISTATPQKYHHSTALDQDIPAIPNTATQPLPLCRKIRLHPLKKKPYLCQFPSIATEFTTNRQPSISSFE